MVIVITHRNCNQNTVRAVLEWLRVLVITWLQDRFYTAEQTLGLFV